MNEERPEVQPVREPLIALFGVMYAAMVAVPWTLVALQRLVADDAWNPYWASGIALAQNGALAAFALARLRRHGVRWSDLRPYVEGFHAGAKALSWGVGLLFLNGALAQISAVAIQAVAGAETVTRLLDREQAAIQRLLDPEAGTFPVASVVFLAVGVAPIVEELFFRGYVYPVLKSRMGRHAMWMSALLFAAVHLYVVNFLPVFALGIALAYLYERTQGLAAPMVAHATINALVAVIAFAAQSAA